MTKKKTENKVSKNEKHETSTYLMLASIVAVVALVAIVALINGNKQAPQPNTESYGVPVQMQEAGAVEATNAETEDAYVDGEEKPADFPAEEENLAGEASSPSPTNCVYLKPNSVIHNGLKKSIGFGNSEDIKYKACLVWLSSSKAKLTTSYYNKMYTPEGQIPRDSSKFNKVSMYTERVLGSCKYYKYTTLFDYGKKKASTFTYLGVSRPYSHPCPSYYKDTINILEIGDGQCFDLNFYTKYLDAANKIDGQVTTGYKRLCKPYGPSYQN